MALWPGVHDREHPSLGVVLVVDDEESIRKVSRLALTKAGYEVLEAENGEKAIEVLNTGENPLTVDVILCDIRMPKINGVEAIKYFQTQYPSVQIIVQTGFPDLNLATSFMKQGIVDYLVKPVEKEKLLAAVAKAAEQRKICNT
jgi:two-component system chemotaxis response regulator CheY